MDVKKFYESRYKNKKFNSDFKIIKHDIRLNKIYSLISRDKKLKNKKILDVGSGDGLVIRNLANKFNLLPYAIDLSEDNINFLKENNVNVSSIDLNSDKFPYADNYFDYIIFSEVIEHIFDCEHTLKEIFRVLKKGGKLYLSTHNSLNLFMRIKFLFGNIPAEALDVTGRTRGEHIRLFNQKNLLKLLLSVGFKKKNIVNESFFKFKKINFKTGFITSLLGEFLFFVCKK